MILANSLSLTFRCKQSQVSAGFQLNIVLAVRKNIVDEEAVPWMFGNAARAQTQRVPCAKSLRNAIIAERAIVKNFAADCLAARNAANFLVMIAKPFFIAAVATKLSYVEDAGTILTCRLVLLTGASFAMNAGETVDAMSATVMSVSIVTVTGCALGARTLCAEVLRAKKLSRLAGFRDANISTVLTVIL